MSYKALYRTYRPQTFDDVVGQDAIVRTLKNAIKTEKIAHAYLFAGPRGTGKTSVAKLMAKAINCLDSDNAPCNKCKNCLDALEDKNPDIIEIDAASNNGVDQIRGIIEQVKYPPMQSKYKVYIIDEVHMLSTGAFNALLKTLEEPPAYVVFILATTEPYKVLPTIISRCQRYDFRKIDNKDMKHRIIDGLKQENISYDDYALDAVISLAQGGMRDAWSILDQCIAFDSAAITLETIQSVFGLTSIESKLQLISYIKNKDVSSLLKMISDMDDSGVDLKRLINDLLQLFKQATCYLYTNDMSLCPSCNEEQMEALTNRTSASQFLECIDVLLKTNNDLKFATEIISYFEVACLKCIDIFNKDNTLSNTSITPIVKQEVVEPVRKVVNKDIFATPVQSIDNKENTTFKIEPIEATVENNNPVEENNVSRETFEEENFTYDDNYLVALIVGAVKSCKEEDTNRFAMLPQHRVDIASGRLVSLLTRSEILACGEDFIIVCCDDEEDVNDINNKNTSLDLEKFYNKCFGITKKIIALDKNKGREIQNRYIQLWKEKNLPEKAIVELQSNKQEKEISFEDKLKMTFKDKLEIEE